MEGERKAVNPKKLKSWQRRKRRRIKRMIIAAIICVLMVVCIILIRNALPYEEVDLCDYVIYEYYGYNTKGSVTTSMNEDLISKLMQRLISDYDESLIHYRKCTPEDYNAFYNSLSVYSEMPDNLSNGSKFVYVVSYDKSLAKKIGLGVRENKREITVEGLTNAAEISLDELFSGINLLFEGVSPALKVTLLNNTTNPYLENATFVIEDEKELYSDGDIIRVRASVNKEEAVEKHFYIDAAPGDYYMDYVVKGSSGYVQDSSDITKEFLDEAIENANKAFTVESAKEYGVRVYFEANVNPVYVNKQSTFEWKSFGPLSAYFKVAHSDITGQTGKEYNMLDLIYNGVLIQADGRTVNVEAVVRFRDIVKNGDGTLTCDFSDPKVVSCSHMDSRIKKNVISNYEDDYIIDKINLK